MKIDNLSSSQQTHTCLSHAAFAVAVSSHLAIWNSIYPKREKSRMQNLQMLQPEKSNIN